MMDSRRLLCLLLATASSLQISLAQRVLEPVFPCSATLVSPYGVTSELTRRNGEFYEREKSVARLEELRADWVRLPMSWEICWHDRHFVPATFDAAMETAGGTPLSVCGVISHRFDKGHDAWNAPSEYSAYVREMVSRYRFYVSCWEIIPGMDSRTTGGKPLTPQQFFGTLRGTYSAIKSVNSGAAVVLGAADNVRSRFLDTLMCYGGAKWFDVMSFACYGDAEELPSLVNAVRRNMNNYGWEKPVWITDARFGSVPQDGDNSQFWEKIVPEALARLGIRGRKSGVAVTVSSRQGYSALNEYEVVRYLSKTFHSVRRVSYVELADLDVTEYPVLIPGKFVSASDVSSYLSRGGTVVLTSPMSPQVTHVGIRNGRDFLYLTQDNLRHGDEFCPLSVDEEGVTAALYHSAGGGNVIACFRKGAAPYVDTEAEQAKRIARVHLIAFSCGVEKVFWNGLRSSENDPKRKRDWSGLYRKDFSPKPAARAYKTLTTLLPSGSGRPELSIRDGVYLAHWIAADGRNVWAVWSPWERTKDAVEIRGKARIINFLGEDVKGLDYTDDAVTYIVGADKVVWR